MIDKALARQLTEELGSSLATTSRGFHVAHFIDDYQEPCSIQESSAADTPCLWLGVDRIGHRMHLTQEMVAAMLPMLQRFVETGKITKESE